MNQFKANAAEITTNPAPVFTIQVTDGARDCSEIPTVPITDGFMVSATVVHRAITISGANIINSDLTIRTSDETMSDGTSLWLGVGAKDQLPKKYTYLANRSAPNEFSIASQGLMSSLSSSNEADQHKFVHGKLISGMPADARPLPKITTVGGLTVYETSGHAGIRGEHLPLTNREFLLLKCLARQAGMVVPIYELRDNIWGTEFISLNAVYIYVGYLRRKLGNDAIENVRDVGYKLRKDM